MGGGKRVIHRTPTGQRSGTSSRSIGGTALATTTGDGSVRVLLNTQQLAIMAMRRTPTREFCSRWGCVYDVVPICSWVQTRGVLGEELGSCSCAHFFVVEGGASSSLVAESACSSLVAKSRLGIDLWHNFVC